MSENQDALSDKPPPFLRPLQMLLVVQVIFNGILCACSTLRSFGVIVAFDPAARVCGAAPWGVAGLYSLLCLIDIFKTRPQHGKVARTIGYLVFGSQAIEYFLGVWLIIIMTRGPADGGFPLVVVGFGLLLAVACLITLWLYAITNPLPEQWLPEPPPAPPPEPEDIEISGDWDEAKNQKPKP